MATTAESLCLRLPPTCADAGPTTQASRITTKRLNTQKKNWFWLCKDALGQACARSLGLPPNESNSEKCLAQFMASTRTSRGKEVEGAGRTVVVGKETMPEERKKRARDIRLIKTNVMRTFRENEYPTMSPQKAAATVFLHSIKQPAMDALRFVLSVPGRRP